MKNSSNVIEEVKNSEDKKVAEFDPQTKELSIKKGHKKTIISFSSMESVTFKHTK